MDLEQHSRRMNKVWFRVPCLGEPMGHLPSPEDGPQQLVEWPVTGLLNSPFGWRGEPLLMGAALTQNHLEEVRSPKIRKGHSRKRIATLPDAVTSSNPRTKVAWAVRSFVFSGKPGLRGSAY